MPPKLEAVGRVPAPLLRMKAFLLPFLACCSLALRAQTTLPDVRKYPAGLYQVKLVPGEHSAVRKLVVER